MSLYISRDTYLMQREGEYPTTEQFELNIAKLLYRVHCLLSEYKKINAAFSPSISSGYRPGHYNKTYSPNSAHVTCEAVDIYDPNGKLKAFCTKEILEKYDLWMEHPDYCKTWAHLSTRPVKSGNRIFKP